MGDEIVPGTEQSVIPAGTEFEVYWCPRCKVQAERSWHFCERGHPMFPQTDIETQCVRAIVVFGEGSRS